MEGNIFPMQDIRLTIEKLNKENFDNFIDLIRKNTGSKESHNLDTGKINRLKENAFSSPPRYEAYLGRICVDWVAYASMVTSYSMVMALPRLVIEEIFVSQNFRNLGIGTAMVEFCIRTAKKKECEIIELSIPNNNKKAKNFFDFNGVIPVDSTYYQIDSYTTKIGRPLGRMTYTDFMRNKKKNQLSRLNSRIPENHHY
jgi:ribosomal protein S18 acetylase RimI-like enzyme